MLAVVMDGIKDAEMLAGYAEQAEDRAVKNWFATRAQNRASGAERDWKDVLDELKKTKHDEELLDALECHVSKSLERLEERVEKI